jgi:hypothetical protein
MHQNRGVSHIYKLNITYLIGNILHNASFESCQIQTQKSKKLTY